jgi:dephospho-CoA kinase
LITEEWAAWDELTSDISKNNIAILESSGLTKSATDIYKLFDKVIIILIDCPEDELVKRIVKRNNSNYIKVPFCYSRKPDSIQSAVSEFSIKLKSIHYDYNFNSNEMTVDEIVDSIESVFQN